jgi:hypothetical protein
LDLQNIFLAMMKAVLLTFLAAAVSVSSFSPIARSAVGRGINSKQSRLFDVNTENKGDFHPEENEYKGSVDWDEEWKKVVTQGKTGKTVPGERPGKDYYKSESEIAAIKVANKATVQATDAATKISNSLPDFQTLSKDWRFWIGILAFVSVVISLLSAPSGMAPSNLAPNGGDSYYI